VLAGVDRSLPVVLLGGKEDAAVAESLVQAIQDRPLYNACGRFSLNQSASLVQQSRLVISNDTGLMHIAAAFKKPLVSIWGNTVSQMGMSPYYGKQDVQQYLAEVPMEQLSCRPCSKLGFSTCPKGHFRCMTDINSSAIAKEIELICK